MKRIKIHKEGYLILMVVTLVIFLINVFVYIRFSGVVLAINVAISAVLLAFVAYFFRNPARMSEIDDPSLVVAPADGTVVVIEPVEETEYFGEKRMQISIFMSPLNVHANWYPISGMVKKSVHHKGNHKMAFLPKSSIENERSTVVIESEGKTQILMRQIAGALARRIVTYAHEGKPCHINEHMGFIKFGSRVDLFLPIDAEIFVTIGEKTTGNETIIARLNE
ncbi:MAG: phosphatidylserine decarboxylase family protein [Paludibacteraceae bacterium]|nr:phosphatidylserine decarboxylase family protein [Paludibacteraceae bacterium]MBO7234727.1 phosphatidylserine decarboxylase family protein [Paludibacteraceae bacterium]MBO7258902.1 phosphatidylserine decarboxylase family protein [Paludibacteraceae bacterium]